jgi:hypothetical protein
MLVWRSLGSRQQLMLSTTEGAAIIGLVDQTAARDRRDRCRPSDLDGIALPSTSGRWFTAAIA